MMMIIFTVPEENGKKVLTMTEYIEKEALMVALCKEIIGDGDYYNGKDDMQDEIRDMVSRFPAADVAPVRHGEWEIVVGSNGNEYMVCTCCRVSQDLTGVFTYCPNCGAKMDGEP